MSSTVWLRTSPESALAAPRERFHYMEQLTLWLGTVTNWGTVDKFQPLVSEPFFSARYWLKTSVFMGHGMGCFRHF